MRLINADELKEKVKGSWGTVGSKRDFIKIIDNAPTVEERPQCEWEEYACSNAHGCSLCGYMDSLYFEHHYCPNCGADMKGGAE